MKLIFCVLAMAMLAFGCGRKAEPEGERQGPHYAPPYPLCVVLSPPLSDLIMEIAALCPPGSRIEFQGGVYFIREGLAFVENLHDLTFDFNGSQLQVLDPYD